MAEYDRSGPSLNDRILFWASFATLIAAGIGFSVRGVEILKDWGLEDGAVSESEINGASGS